MGAVLVTIARLGPYDQHCLRVETAERPVHIGILAILERAPLRDAAGRLEIDAIRREVERRTTRAPELRRVVRRPGLLAGGPIWIDDPAFSIADHVSLVSLPASDDDRGLMAAVEDLLASPLDRSRPLWRMWLIDGLAGGRVGLLFAIHHALADGLTAMRLARSLLDGSTPTGDATSLSSRGEVDRPSWLELVADNARRTLHGGLALLKPSTWRRGIELIGALRGASALAEGAPPSSLNGPVGGRRASRTLRLDLHTAKRVARSHGCGANDVVLGLVAGGARALLTGRGEDVRSIRPRAGVAVALFSADRGHAAGNDIGSLLVPLSLAEQEPGDRLEAIARERERARSDSLVAAEPLIRARLGRFAAYRRALERQRLINLAETYLPGPPKPITALGVTILELIPFAPLAGNLGLSFVALSYAGSLGLTVRADADQFPELDVLAGAMERDWRLLADAEPRRPASGFKPRRSPVPA